MKKIIKKQDQRERRRQRVRSRIFGSKVCPRLNVFRSLKGIYAQLIDDQKGVTLLAVGGKDSKASKSEK